MSKSWRLLTIILVGLFILAALASCKPRPKPAVSSTAIYTALPDSTTRAIIRSTEVVLALTASFTPSPTITDTPSPFPTAQLPPTGTPAPQIQVTSFSSIQYYVRSTANARTCPDTACDLLGQFQAGEIIGVDGTVKGSVFNNSEWWYQTLYLGQVAYIHSSLVIEASLVAQPQSQVQPPSNNISIPPTSEPGFICPSNCTEARARGVSPQQAAACGLDRDGDGQACYADN